MTPWRTIAVGSLALLGAVYLYYTEIKPVVIFGLRSDYAHAIPFQKIPEGLTSLKASLAVNATAKSMKNGSPAFMLAPMKIRIFRPTGTKTSKFGFV